MLQNMLSWFHWPRVCFKVATIVKRTSHMILSQWLWSWAFVTVSKMWLCFCKASWERKLLFLRNSGGLNMSLLPSFSFIYFRFPHECRSTFQPSPPQFCSFLTLAQYCATLIKHIAFWDHFIISIDDHPSFGRDYFNSTPHEDTTYALSEWA